MYEYGVPSVEADTDGGAPLPPDVRLETYPPDEAEAISEYLDVSRPAEPLEEEWVVVATAGCTPIGRTVVSDDAAHYVEPLERTIGVDGAYFRRGFVRPDYRWGEVGRGADE